MRKALIPILMFLMLMPGLACGTFMKAGKAHAAAVSKEMPDCAGMNMGKAQKAPDHGDRFFFKDCQKVDLSSADHPSLETPDVSGKVLFTGWIVPTFDDSFIPASLHAIRGPPPDWPHLSQTYPSILLTTQRLRI